MRRFFVSLFALSIAIPIFAQPLADKVPSGAFIYFGWRGSDDLGPGYADSHTKAILDQSNLPAVFNDMIPRAIMRVGRESPQAADVLRSINAVAAPMWKHPCALFVADADFTKKNPSAKSAVICQAGNDAAMLLQKLQKLVQSAGENSPVPLRAFQSGDLVAFTVGYAEDEQPLATDAGTSLLNDASFASALKNVQKDGVLSLYMNFDRIWSIIDAGVDAQGDPAGKEYWPKVRDAIGLPGLKRLIATAAFDGKDWAEQAFIDAPGPRVGLLTMLDQKPLAPDLLKLAPADSDLVVAGSFDLGKLVSTIRAGIAKVDPRAGDMAEEGFAALSLYVGRDFQREVLDPLGEQWLAYSSPSIAGRGLLGGVIVNKLDNPTDAKTGLLMTQAALFNTISPFLRQKGMVLKTENMKVGDVSISYLAVPLVSPAWSVHGQNLYVSLYPQNIISATRFAKSEGKSIVDNPNFIDMRKRLGGPGEANAVSYIDLPQTVGEGYQGVLLLSRLLLGFGDLFGVKSPEPVIPPLDVFLKHVGPTGAVAWTDQAGWHSRAISSFPGASMMAGGNSAALSVISNLAPLLGVVAPAIGNARWAAKDTTDLSNVRQIGLACLMYSNENKGALPASLGDLAKYVGNNPQVFVTSDRRAEAEAIKNQPPEAIAQWISANTDYEFLLAGQKVNKIRKASETALAYRKQPADSGKTAVVFVDGHAELVEAERLAGLVAK